MSKSLDVFYRSMIARVTNAMRYFDRTVMEMTRDDLADIRNSLFPDQHVIRSSRHNAQRLRT